LGAADDAPEVGADAIRFALAEGVAGGALLRRILAAAGIGAGKPHRQRLLGRRLLARLAMGVFLNRDLVARLLRRMRREQRAGGDIERQQGETGAENCTED